MDNFNWESFTKKIVINTDVSTLYKAWTVPEEIEKWFLKKAVFRNSDGELINLGGSVCENNVFEWYWYLYDGVEIGRVTKANGIDFFQFTFAGDSLVNVKLSQHFESTIVELNQTNIPTDNKSKRDIRIGCEFGWAFFLVNLKSVYEGGLDLRNKDERFKGMLN